jgi:hypothetical protein
LRTPFYDRSEKNAPPDRPLACKAGCDYCCHAFVSLLVPEAFLLAEGLKQRKGPFDPPTLELFKGRALPLRGLDQAARISGASRAALFSRIIFAACTRTVRCPAAAHLFFRRGLRRGLRRRRGADPCV